MQESGVILLQSASAPEGPRILWERGCFAVLLVHFIRLYGGSLLLIVIKSKEWLRLAFMFQWLDGKDCGIPQHRTELPVVLISPPATWQVSEEVVHHCLGVGGR